MKRHLRGIKLKRLNERIHERDKNSCVICGVYVYPGEKFHHEPGGSGRKIDDEQHGVTLCMKCHYQRHHGTESGSCREKIETYLARVYGEPA